MPGDARAELGERVLGVMIGTAQQDAPLAPGRMTRSRIGPLQHVVKAGQNSRLAIAGNGHAHEDDKAKNVAINELKARKLEALSANQMLQSFNEDLGDLLKGLRPYAVEPLPGLGFDRSSDCVERIRDAASIIKPKLSRTSRPSSPRSNSVARSDQVQRLMAELMDVVTLPDLAKVANTFGQKGSAGKSTTSPATEDLSAKPSSHALT